MINILVELPPTDVPVISGGGVDEASAVNISNQISDKLAVHDQIYIGPGWFEIDPGAAAWTTPKHVTAAGSRLTNIKYQGAGPCFDSAGPGSLVKGLTLWDTTVGRVGTGVYVTAPGLNERQQMVEDVHTYGLAAGAHLHGNKAYYWKLADCTFRNGTAGLLGTDDLAAEGPNRGVAINCLTETNDVGYDLQGGNTMEFYACRSANEGTGIRSAVRFLTWIGGAFETYTGNAIETTATATNNTFAYYTKSAVDSVLDNGTFSTFMDNRGDYTTNSRKTVDADPSVTGAVIYESRIDGDAEPRYQRLISGSQHWFDGANELARLRLVSTQMVGTSRWQFDQLIGKQQSLTPVAGAITPDLGRYSGQELVVDVLTANLTINNPTSWPDGLEVKLYLEADASGPYNLTWGSQYNGCPSMIDANKCGWITLKRRSASRVDCIGGNLDLNV